MKNELLGKDELSISVGGVDFTASKIADCLYSEDEIYTYNPKHDDALIHVIEFEAYNKAVEALKVAQKEIQRLGVDAPLELTITTGLINLELIETLRELGVE